MKFLSINGKRIKPGTIISDIKGDQFKFLYLCDGERNLLCETVNGGLSRIFYPSVFNAIILDDAVPKENRVMSTDAVRKLQHKYRDDK